MAKLYFSFTLSRHQGFPRPFPVLAVDLDKDNDPEHDELVNLVQSSGKLLWTGLFDLPESQSVDGARLLLSFNTNPGVDFSLSVNVGKADGPTAYKATERALGGSVQRYIRLWAPQ